MAGMVLIWSRQSLTGWRPAAWRSSVRQPAGMGHWSGTSGAQGYYGRVQVPLDACVVGPDRLGVGWMVYGYAGWMLAATGLLAGAVAALLAGVSPGGAAVVVAAGGPPGGCDV